MAGRVRPEALRFAQEQLQAGAGGLGVLRQQHLEGHGLPVHCCAVHAREAALQGSPRRHTCTGWQATHHKQVGVGHARYYCYYYLQHGMCVQQKGQSTAAEMQSALM